MAASRFLKLEPPAGAMYAFIGVDTQELPDFDDQQFALDLLEQKHVLVAPGASFNVPYRNHFRVTNLPDARDAARRVRRASKSCSRLTRTRRAKPRPGKVVEAQPALQVILEEWV